MRKKSSHRLAEPSKKLLHCYTLQISFSVSSTTPLAVYAVTQVRCLDKFSSSIVRRGKRKLRFGYVSHRLAEPSKKLLHCYTLQISFSVSSTTPLAFNAVTQVRCLDKFSSSIVRRGKRKLRFGYVSLPLLLLLLLLIFFATSHFLGG